MHLCVWRRVSYRSELAMKHYSFLIVVRTDRKHFTLTSEHFRYIAYRPTEGIVLESTFNRDILYSGTLLTSDTRILASASLFLSIIFSF